METLPTVVSTPVRMTQLALLRHSGYVAAAMMVVVWVLWFGVLGTPEEDGVLASTPSQVVIPAPEVEDPLVDYNLADPDRGLADYLIPAAIVPAINVAYWLMRPRATLLFWARESRPRTWADASCFHSPQRRY